MASEGWDLSQTLSTTSKERKILHEVQRLTDSGSLPFFSIKGTRAPKSKRTAKVAVAEPDLESRSLESQ